MTTVINSPGSNGDGIGVGIIVGILLVIIGVVIFVIFGLPAIKQNQSEKTNTTIQVQLP
jgi:hypothetical protein